MPFIEQEKPYLNPYLCDNCHQGISVDGLLEIGTQTVGRFGKPIRVYGRILCSHCKNKPNLEENRR